MLSIAACDCNKNEKPAAETPKRTEVATEKVKTEPLLPLPETMKLDNEKFELGRRLYHDPILSGDGTVSCASCHALDLGGAEHSATSTGIGQKVGPINAPTVFNAVFNFRQFWDGRAADLKEQAGGPVENPIEMGTTFEVAVPKVEADSWYVERFKKVYAEKGISKDTITDAIAEYERGLVTESPFDAYLRGDQSAISEEAKAGYAKFKDTGCTTCHMGVNVGGQMYQKMGLVKDYFKLRGGDITTADLGRYNVTKKEEDRHHFKVPTLRNIELTAPYFHDGSQASLEEAVKVMANVQLAKELSDEEVASIVTFLKTLTGKIPDNARLPAADIPPKRVSDEPKAE